eukprot:69504_1
MLQRLRIPSRSLSTLQKYSFQYQQIIQVPRQENTNQQFPIIEPKFIHNSQFVMEPEKYTIDCSKFATDQINTNNESLRDEMLSKFHHVGLVYLINTSLTQLQAMRQLITILIPDEANMEYKGGNNCRNYIEPNVYDTGAPPEACIHYHHEMEYIRTSPKAIAFCCKSALPNGRGASYVSDQFQVTNELLSTQFGKKLTEKGICYHRSLTDQQHYKNKQQSEYDVYNHWQQSFGTSDPEEAGEIAMERGLQIEWDMNHERYGRYLKTKFYADAYEYFPLLDKNIIFASVATGSMCFDTWHGMKLLPNEKRPSKITYGDDTDFTHDELKQFVDINDKYGIPIEWKVGDIAVCCNYRWAHGRPMYDLNDGEQRELGVILGQVFERQGQLECKW